MSLHSRTAGRKSSVFVTHRHDRDVVSEVWQGCTPVWAGEFKRGSSGRPPSIDNVFACLCLGTGTISTEGLDE